MVSSDYLASLGLLNLGTVVERLQTTNSYFAPQVLKHLSKDLA
jgi:hypothetical protein